MAQQEIAICLIMFIAGCFSSGMCQPIMHEMLCGEKRELGEL
jgi:hypothetical protein